MAASAGESISARKAKRHHQREEEGSVISMA